MSVQPSLPFGVYGSALARTLRFLLRAAFVFFSLTPAGLARPTRARERPPPASKLFTRTAATDS
eukprot:scaffold30973_cov69-Phaeocystis_antarctica.AAC.3